MTKPTATPRTDEAITLARRTFQQLRPGIEQAVNAQFARTLEIESTARQRVIEAIERECCNGRGWRDDILAIIEAGKGMGV